MKYDAYILSIDGFVGLKLTLLRQLLLFEWRRQHGQSRPHSLCAHYHGTRISSIACLGCALTFLTCLPGLYMEKQARKRALDGEAEECSIQRTQNEPAAAFLASTSAMARSISSITRRTDLREVGLRLRPAEVE